MLKNFDTPLDVQGVTRIETTSAVVTEEVIVTKLPAAAPVKEYLVKDDEEWGWQDLRDYVVSQIEERFGPFPRDGKKEKGIFDSFLRRWGAKGPVIARYAFERANGFWHSAPISVNRFCKNSDPYFAIPIAEKLREDPVTGW